MAAVALLVARAALLLLACRLTACANGARVRVRLRWQGCGVLTEGTGFFRASTLVKWLLVQALATSREQAVPLCEAMRRQGLIIPVGDFVPFSDGSAQYRFATPAHPTCA